jgi:hypothetical protein
LSKLLLHGWLLGYEHIGGGCRWNGPDVELRRLMLLLDLLALGFDIHLVLEICAIGFQVGGTSGTRAEVEFDIEAAHADGTMTFGAEMKFMLDFSPCFLQGVDLFLVPLSAIHLFASFGSATPEASKEANADIHNFGGGADLRTDRTSIDGPEAFLAGEPKGKIALVLIADILVDTGNDIAL